jgi:hypothetical protein
VELNTDFCLVLRSCASTTYIRFYGVVIDKA